MQSGVKFNFKIILPIARQQLVSEAKASGLVKGQKGGDGGRQQCQYSRGTQWLA